MHFSKLVSIISVSDLLPESSRACTFNVFEEKLAGRVDEVLGEFNDGSIWQLVEFFFFAPLVSFDFVGVVEGHLDVLFLYFSDFGDVV